jgi:hypothetical protein
MLVSVLIIHYFPFVMLDKQRRNRVERRRPNEWEGHR